MAYFSNGTEGMIFDEECSNCPLYETACPIAFVQMEYNYLSCGNPMARKILNHLVKQEDSGKYIGCQMKPILGKKADEDFKEKLLKILQAILIHNHGDVKDKMALRRDMFEKLVEISKAN